MKLTFGKMIIVIVLVVALLGGGVGGLYLIQRFSLLGGTASAQEAGTPSAAESGQAKAASPGPGMMLPMKERVINLADSGGFQYVKIELALEFDLPDARNLKGDAYKKRQDEFIKEMASRRPVMEDIITMSLSSKTSDMLIKAEGKQQLRDELKSKLSGVVGEHKLTNVYFTQFIIQ
ncbi:MAG: flagellar basal body-associated FliL family protein [Chloroflexi bacterium]|nr:flagellar basal body-associated FliL family protein [Chloroflexota bacterium]